MLPQEILGNMCPEITSETSFGPKYGATKPPPPGLVNAIENKEFS